jgi:hypothetical protein
MQRKIESVAERGMMEAGVRAQAMEEKWDVTFEDERLLFSGSWTGIPIFSVDVSPLGCDDDAFGTLGMARVNADPNAYRARPEEVMGQLEEVVEAVLFGRPLPLPRSEEEFFRLWSNVGAATPVPVALLG